MITAQSLNEPETYFQKPLRVRKAVSSSTELRESHTELGYLNNRFFSIQTHLGTFLSTTNVQSRPEICVSPQRKPFHLSKPSVNSAELSTSSELESLDLIFTQPFHPAVISCVSNEFNGTRPMYLKLIPVSTESEPTIFAIQAVDKLSFQPLSLFLEADVDNVKFVERKSIHDVHALGMFIIEKIERVRVLSMSECGISTWIQNVSVQSDRGLENSDTEKWLLRNEDSKPELTETLSKQWIRHQIPTLQDEVKSSNVLFVVSINHFPINEIKNVVYIPCAPRPSMQTHALFDSHGRTYHQAEQFDAYKIHDLLEIPSDRIFLTNDLLSGYVQIRRDNMLMSLLPLIILNVYPINSMLLIDTNRSVKSLYQSTLGAGEDSDHHGKISVVSLISDEFVTHHDVSVPLSRLLIPTSLTTDTSDSTTLPPRKSETLSNCIMDDLRSYIKNVIMPFYRPKCILLVPNDNLAERFLERECVKDAYGNCILRMEREELGGEDNLSPITVRCLDDGVLKSGYVEWGCVGGQNDVPWDQ